ncbi:PAS domain S-box protein [Methanoregula sp. UBA64]|uniref:hybrid sensor histidine kinase/response regulator n=1 Tax=Methanoregula sp. UBA64 TaxID=1915554 RepID=UPI0025DDAB10|nr:PAS domain S-box protein [Methanoregula sp. UBA64]
MSGTAGTPERIRVLYVDDEPQLLEIGRLFLEKSGAFAVDTSDSAATVLKTGNFHRYECIVSDYQMPGMDGIAFLQELRAKKSRIPFILFTGKGREEVVIKALNCGADFYLQKGGDPRSQFTELGHMIRHAVQEHRATEELIRSKKLQGEIIDFLPDATFAIDLAGTVIAWNRAMEDLTGVRCSDILGRDMHERSRAFYQEHRSMLADLILSPDAAFEQEHYVNTVHGPDRALTAETQFTKNDGTTLYLWMKAGPLIDPTGTITGVIESIRDISARRKTEMELRESFEQLTAAEEELRQQYEELRQSGQKIRENEEKYRLVTDNCHNSVALVQDERIVFCNRRMSECFGYLRDELKGSRATDYILPEDRAHFSGFMQKMRTSKVKSHTVIIRIRTKGREVRDGECIGIRTQYQNEPAVLLLVTDITESRRSIRTLENANKKLRLLDSITRHDIANKLLGLSGYIARMEKSTGETEIKQDLPRIAKLSREIGAMLEFSRSYQGLGFEDPVWQEVSVLIARERELLEEKDLVLSDRLAGLELFADPLLPKVFFNLMDNTLRHGGTATSMVFRYELRGTGLAVIAEDNGRGIPATAKKHLFLHGKGEPKGRGLFLIKEILAISGFTITENGDPGKGARFEIGVPEGKYRFTGTALQD